MLDQQPNNPHQRLYQRRKRRPLRSYATSSSSSSSSSNPRNLYSTNTIHNIPSTTSGISGSGSGSTPSSPTSSHRNFNDEFRNRFLAKIFISFTIVWTFFTFQSEQPPYLSNIITNPHHNGQEIVIPKGGGSGGDGESSESKATIEPMKNKMTEEPSLSLRGNRKQSQSKESNGFGLVLQKLKQGLHMRRNKNDNNDNNSSSNSSSSNTTGQLHNTTKSQQQQLPPKAAFVLVATKDLHDPMKSMSNAIESILESTPLERILIIIPIISNSILQQNGLHPNEVKQYFEVDLVQHYYESAQSSKKNKKNKQKNRRKKNKYQQQQMMMRNSEQYKDNIDILKNEMATIKLMIEGDDDVDHDTGKNKNTNTTTSTTISKTYGVGQSRRNAAQYIKTYYHQEQMNATKKAIQNHIDPETYIRNDDVILTFLRPDSQIENDDWLDIVTDALQGTIPSSSSISSTSSTSSMSPIDIDLTQQQESFHFQNAVSFTLSQKTKKQQHMNDRKNRHHPHYHHHYSHQYLFNHNKDPHHFTKSKHTTTSLDINLTPIHSTTPLDWDVKLTKGKAYPTPILEGSATSLLLSTFLDLNTNLNLPLADKYVTSTVAADIELSLNLWLCGSGIDVLTDLHVEKDVVLLQNERDVITNEEKVWLTREWMTDKGSNRSSFEDHIAPSTSNGSGSSSSTNDNHILGGANVTSMSIGDKILVRLNHTGAFNDTRYDQILFDMIHNPNYDATQPHQLEKCRTFDWYTREVNLMMGKQLQMFDRFVAEAEKGKITKVI